MTRCELFRARMVSVVSLAFIIIMATAASVVAQPLPQVGGRVFGLVGGSFGEGGQAPLVAGGAGLRLTRNIGLDLEVLHVEGLGFSSPDFLIQRGAPEILFAPPFRFAHESSVTAFTTRVTAEFPVAGDRLFPFLTGGGGVGRSTERFSFRCVGGCPVPAVTDLRLGSSIYPYPDANRSQTGLALTVGGGVDVRLWRGMAVGGEVRWFRLLLDQQDHDAAHVAARASYRF